MKLRVKRKEKPESARERLAKRSSAWHHSGIETPEPRSRAMESVTQLAQILRHVLETEARQLARETGWQQRERKLSGADFGQTLIFGWVQEPENRKSPWMG
jgi:hypothetical protein